MTSHRTLSAQAGCWFPEKVGLAAGGALRVPLFFPSSFSFLFVFPSIHFSKDPTPSLSPRLPLSQTPSKTPFLSPPRPLRSSTPQPSIPSKPSSLPPSSRQAPNINHKKPTKIPKSKKFEKCKPKRKRGLKGRLNYHLRNCI